MQLICLDIGVIFQKRYDNKEASMDVFAFTLHAKVTKALMLLRYFKTPLTKVFYFYLKTLPDEQFIILLSKLFSENSISLPLSNYLLPAKRALTVRLSCPPGRCSLLSRYLEFMSKTPSTWCNRWSFHSNSLQANVSTLVNTATISFILLALTSFYRHLAQALC